MLQQNPTARILYVVRDPRAIFHSIKNIGTMRIDDDLLAQIRHYFYIPKIIISISILDNYKFSKIFKNKKRILENLKKIISLIKTSNKNRKKAKCVPK